jgi:hypothetical protein
MNRLRGLALLTVTPLVFAAAACGDSKVSDAPQGSVSAASILAGEGDGPTLCDDLFGSLDRIKDRFGLDKTAERQTASINTVGLSCFYGDDHHGISLYLEQNLLQNAKSAKSGVNGGMTATLPVDDIDLRLDQAAFGGSKPDYLGKDDSLKYLEAAARQLKDTKLPAAG